MPAKNEPAPKAQAKAKVAVKKAVNSDDSVIGTGVEVKASNVSDISSFSNVKLEKLQACLYVSWAFSMLQSFFSYYSLSASCFISVFKCFRASCFISVLFAPLVTIRTISIITILARSLLRAG